MRPFIRLHHALVAICLTALAVGFSPHAAHGENFVDVWPMDRLKLSDGRTLAGLIEWPDGRDAQWLELTEIIRRPGRPTGLIVRPIIQREVESVVMLSPTERSELRNRIERIRCRAKIEARRLDAITLTPGKIEIPGPSETQTLEAHRYDGRHFTLLTTTDEPTARRLAVHIEQLFGALRQLIPPRATSDRPIRFLVFASPISGQRYLESRGGPADPDIQFPDGFACFLEKEGEVIVALEWARYDEMRRALDREIEAIKVEIEAIETTRRDRLENLNRRLRGATPAQRAEIMRQSRLETVRVDKKIKECRRVVATYRRKTETLLDGFIKQLLAALNHEAWHAYSRAYVFPPNRFVIPPWLDEGLAMTFEGGILEQGMLRIDTPNRSMLEALADRPPMPLDRLLTAPRSAFQENDRAAAHYATAWALVYLLTVEKGILTGKTIDRLIPPKAEENTATQAKRLEALTGIPLDRLNTYLPVYIEQLKKS